MPSPYDRIILCVTRPSDHDKGSRATQSRGQKTGKSCSPEQYLLCTITRPLTAPPEHPVRVHGQTIRISVAPPHARANRDELDPPDELRRDAAMCARTRTMTVGTIIDDRPQVPSMNTKIHNAPHHKKCFSTRNIQRTNKNNDALLARRDWSIMALT